MFFIKFIGKIDVYRNFTQRGYKTTGPVNCGTVKAIIMTVSDNENIFKYKNHRGEWFMLNEDDINGLSEICENVEKNNAFLNKNKERNLI